MINARPFCLWGEQFTAQEYEILATERLLPCEPSIYSEDSHPMCFVLKQCFQTRSGKGGLLL